MRKRDFCLCENKGADQLCSNCTADQRLCFHYSDSTISLLLLFYLNPNFQAASFLLRQYRPVCVGPGRKPRRPVFSHHGSYVRGKAAMSKKSHYIMLAFWHFQDALLFCLTKSIYINLSHVKRKPVFRVSDTVLHKPACIVAKEGNKLELLIISKRRIVLSEKAKTEALISCAVTAQLLCAFVFTHAKKQVFSSSGSFNSVEDL